MLISNPRLGGILLAAKANIIKIYADADSAKKVDIICRYYQNFMGIVNGHTEGLRYMIENEKSYNRKVIDCYFRLMPCSILFMDGRFLFEKNIIW